ncbi:MAG: GtrA family protein [Pseudonocardia sp.]
MRATPVEAAGDRPAVVVARSQPLYAQIARYVLVGAASTALSATLFYLLRTWWPPLPSSLLAVALSTVYSTEANRTFTFADARWWRVYVQGLGTFAFYASYGAVVLSVLPALVTAPTPVQETIALSAASVLGGTSRYLLLRCWVFARSEPPMRPRAGAMATSDAGVGPGLRGGGRTGRAWATPSRDEPVVLLHDDRCGCPAR